MVSVLFALLTALFNGLASVLQRMAASTAPAAKTLHLSLFTYLFKHKVWLAGIGMVVLASVCQAIALATGPVALVQPIFIIELPFTLLVASRLARRKLPRTTWIAVALVTVSLGLGLAAAAPSGGGTRASIGVWVLALIVTGAFEAVVIAAGLRARGNARAARVRTGRCLRLRADRDAAEERGGGAGIRASARSSAPGSCTGPRSPGSARCSCCRTPCRPAR